MPVAPKPREILERSRIEGEHRLDSTLLGLSSRAFIAGFNIVFGVVALGVVYALVAAGAGEALGDLAGGVAFGIGVVFLVVGRSDLFSENFLDPVAAALKRGGRAWAALVRLWVVTLVANLIGGAALTMIITTPGALPDGAAEPLAKVAEEIARMPAWPAFMNAILAGAVLTLMTWLLQAVDSIGSRIAIAWIVGAFVAIGPFNHVVVTELHLLVGLRYDAAVGWSDLASTFWVATLGNVVGGLLFVTLTHLGQVAGEKD